MRPCCWAKRIQEIGLGAFFLAVPIGGPNHKARLANAIIAPATQDLRKLLRRQSLAALIKQHGAMRGLRVRYSATCLRQFSEFGGPGDPLFITRDKLRLG